MATIYRECGSEIGVTAIIETLAGNLARLRRLRDAANRNAAAVARANADSIWYDYICRKYHVPPCVVHAEERAERADAALKEAWQLHHDALAGVYRYDWSYERGRNDVTEQITYYH